MAGSHRDDRIIEDKDVVEKHDANRDPITGTPGAHPVGTGAGAAAAGAAGAAIGTAVGGPIGGVAGAVVGAVAGGLGGKAAAEAVNPTVEEEYWRTEYRNRPYASRGDYPYEDYAPAYRYGWETYGRRKAGRFEDIEPELERGLGARPRQVAAGVGTRQARCPRCLGSSGASASGRCRQ